MKNPFTVHPAEVGETYVEHLRAALEVVGRLAMATHCQLLHAVFPFIKPPFNSDIESLIEFLKENLPENRQNTNASPGPVDEALRHLSPDEVAEFEETVDLYTTYGGD